MSAETAAPVVHAEQPRLFGNPELDAQIQRVLSSLPEDGKFAVLDIGQDAHGIRGVLALKLERGWSIAGALEKRFKGTWTGQVQARKIWK